MNRTEEIRTEEVREILNRKSDKTLRIRVFGIVQGVGFRPTVSRHADKNHIKGSVANTGPYVEIWAQGSEADLHSFCQDIRENPPERAVILKMHVEDIFPEGEVFPVFSTFSIIESEKKTGDIFVSPDIAICEKCKQEMYDKTNRRYLHPFINCTCCGPRLTILDAMPYDRERTSMSEFPMCEQCEWEYTHPQTRRYDAQPVCCNECGPEVYILEQNRKGSAFDSLEIAQMSRPVKLVGRKIVGKSPEKIDNNAKKVVADTASGFVGAEAIRLVRKIISQGGIAAIKGIGGFHLCCDATSEAAVMLLRNRKHRPIKPFAVMMRDMDTVRRECHVKKEQEEILDGHQKPILLLERNEGGRICPAVAPGNPKVGVMLPYAPIQLLLFDYDDEISMPDCLVMTSANTSGAPICRDDDDALRELGHLCDVILSHNRLIRIRADDTVMDFFRGEPYMIRRSRGYAPLPVMLSTNWTGEVLAVGGELKNTFCVGKNDLLYPSPYIGDMGDVRTVRALEESMERMTRLLEARPALVACDLHPDYNTTAVAEKMGLPVLKIQHHYAHILSCMAENDWNDPVIGVAFDGTGYGGDGTIWGGELMTADYEGFVRKASITPFLHVGGDIAAKEGWRIAVSMLHGIFGEEEACRFAAKWNLCTEKEAKILCKMCERRINAVASTSAGRLFDAVSAILGICRNSTFEGEASTSLEFAAEAYEKKMFANHDENLISAKSYEKALSVEDCWNMEFDSIADTAQKLVNEEKEEDVPFLLPTHILFHHMVEGRQQGEDAGKLSYLFHKGLAQMIVEACKRIREESGLTTVALSGGVYQNQLLLRLSVEGLEEAGFYVLIHHLIPPNDGGICLGQAAAAMAHLQKQGIKSKK